MKLIITSLILIGLATSGFSATFKTIPDLYKLNNGSFTSDYSVTYNNPLKSGDFGTVSEAGDINNDGIPDLLLGNPSYDNNRGLVYVIYGKPGSLRQFNSMDDFQPSDGFILRGAADGLNFGASVTAGGDVNGDGIDDIIIGTAPSSNNGEVPAAYVIFGRKSSSEFPSFIEVNRLSSTQAVKIIGRCCTTFKISGRGDVNGDGVNDIIIGNPATQMIYVHYGSKQGLTDMKLEPEAGKGFIVDAPEYSLGGSLSMVGDFNGDGVDDFILGSGHTARALVLLGRREGFPTKIYKDYFLTKYVVMIMGDLQGDDFGCSVSRAGDFNGDGLQDVIIGAPGANSQKGIVYLIFGSRENTGALMTSHNDFKRGFKMMSMTSVNSPLGRRVSGGRDLNGDGLSDIIMQAPGLNKDKGAVYVIYGFRTSPPPANIQLDDIKSDQGYVMYGAKEGDKFGFFATIVKDVNNDGMNDLFIGAPGSNGKQGTAYLLYTPWKCSANCASCSKPDTCESCASGFAFLNGYCTLCPTTHTLVDGVCKLKCPANCASCSRPNTCDSCVQGYGLLGGECTICNSATHILAGGFCLGKCGQNCAYCEKPGSCDLCAPGFGFLGNFCTQCPSSTHFLNHGICQEKRPRCIQWASPDVCEACAPGFGFLNGDCISCPSETHTLKNGSCIAKCPENCAQCNQPNSCSACVEGFGFLGDACVVCPEKTHFLDNGVCHEDRDAWRQIKDFFDDVFHKKN